MYTIRREHLFEREFSEIAKNYSRIADLESAIDWFLGRSYRNEKYVSRISDSFYIWKMSKVHNDFPQLVILYKVDDMSGMVYLMSVKEI
jgi:hypothetical protein